MTQLVAIRTNASAATGIGHLARTYHLAAAIKKQGLESHFFLDKKEPFFDEYLHPFSCTYLYQEAEAFYDEVADARRFVALGNKDDFLAVIVDDYRLARDWEENAASLGCPLVVLDDRDSVSHECSMIIDAKWTGDSTNERYRDKVPEECVRLLGPKYVLMGEAYSNESNSLSKNRTDQIFSIMLSLGGGGDMGVLKKLLEKLLRYVPEGKEFLVRTVVGPFATDREKILSLVEGDLRVQPIIGSRDLHDSLRTTSLFVGAAGGTLYEVLAMNIPAITYTLSDNQNNQLSHLEDLGHYFHLNDFCEDSFEKLAELVWLMEADFKRVRRLYSLARKVKIDGLGTERVAKAIKTLLKGAQPISEVSQEPVQTTGMKKEEYVDEAYIFETIDDRHVNRYLEARNFDSNLQNMTEREKVSQLDHYIWWFTNKRVSFLLKKVDAPFLYIWHQQKTIEGVKVLFGGWFACSETCNALDTVYALQRQLELTDREFAGIPWVAVIKNSNRFVQSLNKRFGFKKMNKDHNLFRAVHNLFPSASLDEFGFFHR